MAEKDGKIKGHILFTKIIIGGVEALCLAPISVLPEYQKKGVGTALIGRGHEIAPKMGIAYVRWRAIRSNTRASAASRQEKYMHADKSVTGAAVFPPEFY